jgi:membrane associated rhomboid family serine protease
MSFRQIPPNDGNYFKTIQSRFMPNFKFASMSTVLILLNIIIFILIHIVFSPSEYDRFLSWPNQMDKWLLDIDLIRANRMYMYQTVTAMFMHQNYLHILGNMIFALIVMYEMENSWKWSIPLGVFAGFCANCLAVLTLEGRCLGFSGVLASYTGMILLLLVTHFNYLQNRGQMCVCGFIVALIVLPFLFSSSLGSTLIHLFGLVFGVLFAAGFYPKHQESFITPTCGNIFKGIALLCAVVVIVLAFVFG